MNPYTPQLIPALTPKVMRRFQSKVTIGSPQECWPWFAGTTADGYGSFWIGESRYYAHRVAYVIANRRDPSPFLIRHTCDNKWCCNPNHLIPGTHKDNRQDAIERNRIEFYTKLTNEQVANVLTDRAAGTSILELCRKYKVTQGAIIPIIKGKTRRCVIGPRERQKKQLTAAQRSEIRAKRAQGMTLTALAKEYGKSFGSIQMLCQGLTWKADLSSA